MLLVLCSQYSTRLSYTLSWICSQWNIPFKITDSTDDFSGFSGARIIYQAPQNQANDAVAIKPSGLLEETGVRPVDAGYGTIGAMPVLFKNDSDVGFDVFSAVFYMISRYEEYLPFQPDRYGRFPAKLSTAFNYGFLRLPVVDLWIEHLQTALKKQFPELQFRGQQFDGIVTYDIDLAYKYKGKSLLRNLGGLAKDMIKLSLRNVLTRIGVTFGGRKDPWDFYGEILNSHSDIESKPIFFFPAGERTDFDNNLLPRQSAVSKLIQKIKSTGEVGLHPSFYSAENPELIATEKEELEKVYQAEVKLSRQHFLKFKMPDTYRALIEGGISSDFSMAYPEAPGFRAGTARPFFFYDLSNECTTRLQLYPPCCMDATFIQYIDIEPGAALEEMKYFLRIVAEHGGIFIPIFHNHTFEDMRWLEVHEKIINEIRIDKNKQSKVS